MAAIMPAILAASCEPAEAADNDGMTQPGGDLAKRKKPAGRGERLAAALRENLRRRKAQERQRSAKEPSAAAPHDDKNR